MFHRAMVQVGEWGSSIGQALYWVMPGVLRRRRGRVPALRVFEQLDRFAVEVLPLLVVVLGCVGMILALQLATILEVHGIVAFLPDILGVAMVREMAPLLVGIVLAGFAGATIATEVGSMKEEGELTAEDNFATPPTRLLLAPRLVAIAIAAPLVTGFGFYVGIAGGLVISEMLIGTEVGHYLTRTTSALAVGDVVLGLVKAEVFGLAVVSIAWCEGSRATGGSSGVGRATSAAVLKSIVAVITADLFLTLLAYQI